MVRDHVNASIDGQNPNRSHHNQLTLKRRDRTPFEWVRLSQGQEIQGICLSSVKDAIHEIQHKGAPSLPLPPHSLTSLVVKRMNDITLQSIYNINKICPVPSIGTYRTTSMPNCPNYGWLAAGSARLEGNRWSLPVGWFAIKEMLWWLRLFRNMASTFLQMCTSFSRALWSCSDAFGWPWIL